MRPPSLRAAKGALTGASSFTFSFRRHKRIPFVASAPDDGLLLPERRDPVQADSLRPRLRPRVRIRARFGGPLAGIRMQVLEQPPELEHGQPVFGSKLCPEKCSLISGAGEKPIKG